jgi:hypothetical protein
VWGERGRGGGGGGGLAFCLPQQPPSLSFPLPHYPRPSAARPPSTHCAPLYPSFCLFFFFLPLLHPEWPRSSLLLLLLLLLPSAARPGGPFVSSASLTSLPPSSDAPAAPPAAPSSASASAAPRRSSSGEWESRGAARRGRLRARFGKMREAAEHQHQNPPSSPFHLLSSSSSSPRPPRQRAPRPLGGPGAQCTRGAATLLTPTPDSCRPSFFCFFFFCLSFSPLPSRPPQQTNCRRPLHVHTPHSTSTTTEIRTSPRHTHYYTFREFLRENKRARRERA